MFLLNQLALVIFSVINAYLDAYRILKHKEIAHAINFIAYGLFTALIVWHAGYDLKNIILFSYSAFFQRQLSFDITLNLRRHLKWYYQSAANPPKAILDRIERKLFGIDYDGKKIVMWYSVFYVFGIVIKFASP